MHRWIVSIGAALRARAQRMTVPQSTVRAAAVLRRIFLITVSRGVDRWPTEGFENDAVQAFTAQPAVLTWCTVVDGSNGDLR